VPAIAQVRQEVRQPIEATVETGAKRKRDLAVDVDGAGEVRLQQADIAECDGAPLCAPGPERHGERGACATILDNGAVREHYAERNLGAGSDRSELACERGGRKALGVHSVMLRRGALMFAHERVSHSSLRQAAYCGGRRRNLHYLQKESTAQTKDALTISSDVDI
jgi:hypothetical protein